MGIQVRLPLDYCDIQCADYQDFLDSFGNNSIDLVLTDPPYAISRDTGFKSLGANSVSRFAVSMDFGGWDHQEIDLDALAARCYAKLRKGGTIIAFYDIWKIESLKATLEAAGFVMIRLIIWQKKNPVPLNSKRTYLSNSREIAVVGVKVGKPTFNAEYHNGVYHYPIPRHNGNRIHPTQKPDDLFAELVQLHSHAGDLVVDPFLGGGTTAVAAISQQRRFADAILIAVMLIGYWSGCNDRPAQLEAAQGVYGGFVPRASAA